MTMKKYFYSTLVLALSSMLFFSCSKSDDVVVNDEDVIVKATLIAGNPVVDPGTKTEVHGTTPYWSVGDAIGVTNGTDSNEKFNSSITSASTTATFSGETVSGDLYAYYPYSTGGVSTSGASIALSAEQNPSATSFDGSEDVLVSKMFTVTPENTTVSGLVFKRLTSVIKVVLKDTENQLNGEHPTFVSVEADNNLIGNVLVDFAGQSLSLQSNPSKKVTANYTAATQFEIDGTNGAYLVVLPQTLAGGSTLIVKANTENYYIEKTISIPASGIEITEGKITTLNISLPSGTVTHHPVINVTSANPMEANNLAGSYTINYTISNPLSGESISATADVDWISNINVSTSGEVSFNVARQDYYALARTGKITLSYKDAADVVVTVKQAKGYDPEINVDSEKKVNNIAGAYTFTYTITNPFTGTTITASTTDSWISNISVNATSGEVTFNVAAQENNAEERTGHITVSYIDRNNNNAVVTSKVVNVIQRKGRIFATLAVTTNTSVSSPADDKGNTWSCTTDSGVSLTILTSSGYSYIQAGTANKQHPQNLTLTLSGHSTYQIWAVTARAAADSKATAYTYITIGGSQEQSTRLTSDLSTGGTPFEVVNESPISGNIVINIRKDDPSKDHIYFNQLTVLYDEKTFEDWFEEL